MTGRSGVELADAFEAGEELTPVEQLRVVLAVKDAQISRLAGRIGNAIVAVQAGEPEHVMLGILRGELTYNGDEIAEIEGQDV